MRFRRLMSLLPTFIVVACAPGCSSSLKPPTTVPVSGSVMFKGKAAAGIRVKFHPQFNIGKMKYIPYGETGRDGMFQLSTGAPGNGAPKGEYLVTMEMPIVAEDPADGLEGEVDQLKQAYSDPAKSQWKVTLHDGENVLPPFQLN